MTETRPSQGYVIDAGTATGLGMASELAGMTDEAKTGSFGASDEQIFSPIQIKKNAQNANSNLPSMRQININSFELGNFASRSFTPGNGGVVPYAEDLDPYFFDKFGNNDTSIIEKSDFVFVVNESNDEPDLAVARNSDIFEVRTMGMRGPMLMSGWGYDVGDKPVPSLAQTGDNSFKFAAELGNDRTKWKSGPVHLMWDDERKVWTGGLPMLMGVAISDITAPPDPRSPTIFQMEVLRADGSGPFVTLPNAPERVELSNYDPSIEQKLILADRDPDGTHDWVTNPSLVWVLAVKMNYTWIPFYVGCPPECVTNEHCVNIYGPGFECEEGDCVSADGGGGGGGGGGDGGCTDDSDCPVGECCYHYGVDGSESTCLTCFGL